jgi:hypothetical protein
VPDSEDQPHYPALFAAALDSIRHADPRAELVVTEINAPGNLAPYSVALSADVTPVRHGSDSEFGTGRFILLYDPEEPESWGGPFRVVCFAQAPLETDIGIDPFLAEVAWAWLVDALDSRGAAYTAASGTATKILSSGFGELAHQGDGAQIELRASWSPLDSDLAAHVEGWGELLCMLAGLPPTSEVPNLPRRAHPSRSGGAERPAPARGHGGNGPAAPTGHGARQGGAGSDDLGPEGAAPDSAAHDSTARDGVQRPGPELGGPERGRSAHALSDPTAGIALAPLAPIGPMPVPMRRTGPGLHTLGVAAAVLDPGGVETVGIDGIGLKTHGTVGAGRETVGMNTAGTSTAESFTIDGNTVLNRAAHSASATSTPAFAAGAEPDLAGAGESGRTLGTTHGPGASAQGAHTFGVADLSAHRASRA